MAKNCSKNLNLDWAAPTALEPGCWSALPTGVGGGHSFGLEVAPNMSILGSFLRSMLQLILFFLVENLGAPMNFANLARNLCYKLPDLSKSPPPKKNIAEFLYIYIQIRVIFVPPQLTRPPW